MSRKIFVIVNTADAFNPNSLPVILSGVNSALTRNADGLLSFIDRDELPESFLSQYQSINITEQVPYLDRRAKARRVLANLKADGFYPEHLRIVEVGDFERSIRPVKQWQVLGAISSDGGTTFEDYKHLDFFPLRSEARTYKADQLSKDAEYRTKWPLTVIRWKYKIVPVYAD